MSTLSRTLVLFAALVTAMASGWSNTVLAAAEKKKTVHSIRPEACMNCHEAIYKQWRISMHANSSALNDPIHRVFYKKLMGDPTQEGVRGPQIPVKKNKYPVCLKCHAPVAAIDKKTKLDAKPEYANGVGCTSCHSFTAFKGTEGSDGKLRYGVDAYEFDSSHLYGPSGITYTVKRTPEDAEWPVPVHHPQPMKGNKADLFKSNDVCMGCHDKRVNAHKAPLCITGNEYARSGSSVNCQSCHMPIVTVQNSKGDTVTVADHSMAGGHNDKMVARGLTMHMEILRNGQQVIQAKLTLRNRLPHSFPTGAPFRNFYIKLAAYDADGKELWRNYKTHPIKDDPQAAFWYALGDVEKEKPTLPPVATGLLSDTRLGPHETRLLNYEIPANDNIVIIRAEALYNLLLPKIAKNLADKLPPELLKPKLAASAEVRF